MSAVSPFRIAVPDAVLADLNLRLRNTRWPEAELLYQPAAQVRHRVPAGRASWRYFRARCYHEGRSKALVAQLVGASDGLSAERTYTLRTLPQGCARGLADALGGDAAGLGRAGAIAGGLALTAGGYLLGRMASQPGKRAVYQDDSSTP